VAENAWMTAKEDMGSDECSPLPRIEQDAVITVEVLEDELENATDKGEFQNEVLDFGKKGQDL
jgi:hypothetical protein